MKELRKEFENEMGSDGNPLGDLWSSKVLNGYIIEAYNRSIIGVCIQVWEKAGTENQAEQYHPKNRPFNEVARIGYGGVIRPTPTREQIEKHREKVKEMKEDYNNLSSGEDVRELIDQKRESGDLLEEKHD